jgi:hypothetical protein
MAVAAMPNRRRKSDRSRTVTQFYCCGNHGWSERKHILPSETKAYQKTLETLLQSK